MNEKIIYHELGKDPLFKIWHASEQAMFIYTYSDGGSIVCSEKSYPIKNGVLCFIGAGKYHYTMPEKPKSYDRSKLFVDGSVIDKICQMLPIKSEFKDFSSRAFVYAMINEEDRDTVDKIFEKLKAYENNKAYKEWILYSCIIELLVFLNRYSLENTPHASGIIFRAIEYINSNIKEAITLDDICAEMHISKYYFCRQFKLVTGTTIMKYILRTRIVMAKNMLLHDNLTISEISNRCGFSSVSYFSRAFKEQTGISPLNYKKTRNI